jgi:branched-chain amino acid aminotransferase
MNERIEINKPLVDQRTRIKSVTLNGKRMPLKEAKISIMSPGLAYAATVFEGVRAYWNEEQGELFVFRIDDHLKRLENSMKMLRFDSPPSSNILRAQVIEDIRANE